MPEPLIETISAALLTTLATQTTGNGYHHTVTWHRSQRLEFIAKSPSEFTGVIHQTDASLAGEPSTIKSEWLQGYELEIILPEQNTARAANRVFGDIQKIINANRTFSAGMLPGTLIDSFRINTDAARVTLIVGLTVHYRTAFADPETA